MQSATAKAVSASKDLQSVTTDVVVNYSINEKNIIDIYSKVGNEKTVATNLVDPIIQEVVKATTAKYNAEELITKRDEVSNLLLTGISDKVSKFGITINNVNITNFEYSPQFSAAIETKVTAAQNALAEQNKLATIQYQAQQVEAKADGDAQAKITNAKAEAEAIKIQSEAITIQGGKDYVELQKINKWDGVLPKIVSGNSPLFMDISSETSTPSK